MIAKSGLLLPVNAVRKFQGVFDPGGPGKNGLMTNTTPPAPPRPSRPFLLRPMRDCCRIGEQDMTNPHRTEQVGYGQRAHTIAGKSVSLPGLRGKAETKRPLAENGQGPLDSQGIQERRKGKMGHGIGASLAGERLFPDGSIRDGQRGSQGVSLRRPLLYDYEAH